MKIESTVHIITPLNRVENFGMLLKSVDNSFHIGNVVWWVVVDGQQHVFYRDITECAFSSKATVNILLSPVAGALAGHAHRNHAMRHIREHFPHNDWIYFLDDDNLMHPGLVPTLQSTSSDVVLVDQIFRRKYLTFLTRIRKADPAKVRMNCVDTAQFAFRLHAADGFHWREDLYSADGLFIEELHARNLIQFINKPLSFYNWLR
jgi:hypothetical protein